MANIEVDVQEELEQQRRLAEADAYLYWLFRNLEAHIGQRVLEVGCAIGNITQFLIGREHVVGIDIAPEMIEEARKRFRGQSFEGHVYDITDPAVVELASEAFDTIVCPHVLEHVRDDDAALDHMHELLPDGGTLILLVPTVKWVWGTLDEATGHQRRYTWRELRAQLLEHNYEIVDHWYVNFLAIFGWFITGRVMKKRVIPTGQYSLYNKITPILARLETWLRPPTGLSVVCICRVRK